MRTFCILKQRVSVQRIVGEFPLVSLWWQFWQLRAGILAWRDWGSRKGVGIWAEHTPATQNPRRWGARRSVGGAGARAGFPQPVGISVKASHRWRLEIEGTVHKVLWRAEGNWRRGVGKRVSWRRWRRALQWLVRQASVGRDSWLNLWRRRLPGWDRGRIIVRSGTALEHRREQPRMTRESMREKEYSEQVACTSL